MKEMTILDPAEQERTYIYADGSRDTLTNVSHFAYSERSQTHRLRTADGLLHIVAPGWRRIEIRAEAFTV